MNPLYLLVAERANHACEYCHAPELVFNFPFEVEHIVPLCRGGLSEVGNLALSYRSCNLHKGTQTYTIDPESQAQVSLFHPRTMPWLEHFSVNSETGEIIGITAIGRVTVTVLKLNSINQLEARRLWIQLSLFP
jgi:hypothetical protein